MAAVDSFHLLYREVARTCHNNVEFLAVVGALYTAKKGLCILYDCCRLIRLHVAPFLLRDRDLVQQYGEWAVVTGATSSIGRAYADELARYGMKIVLICSRREELLRVSETITASHGVSTSCVDVDLSRGRDVYPSIAEALRGLDVGVLVNNAAVFDDYPESLVKDPEDKVWEMLHVNVAAAAVLAHIVLPGMVRRRRGAVVNVISGSDDKRDAQTAACKAYLETFSRHLGCEVSSSGVFVQCLTPLCIGSSRPSASGISLLFAPSPDVYARHAVRTLGSSTRTTGYWAHSLQLLAGRWIPGCFCRSIGRFAQQ